MGRVYETRHIREGIWPVIPDHKGRNEGERETVYQEEGGEGAF